MKETEEETAFQGQLKKGDSVLIQRPGKDPEICEIQSVRTRKGGSQYKIRNRWISNDDARAWIKAACPPESIVPLLAHGKRLERERNRGNCFGVSEALIEALRGGLIASQAFHSVTFGKFNLKTMKSGPRAGMIKVNWELYVQKEAPEEGEEG